MFVSINVIRIVLQQTILKLKQYKIKKKMHLEPDQNIGDVSIMLMIYFVSLWMSGDLEPHIYCNTEFL